MISDNEQKILEVIRELRPYEKVEIQKDQNGKPDYFIIKREQKIFLNNNFPKVAFDLTEK